MKFQYAHPSDFPQGAGEFISDTEYENFDNFQAPTFPNALFVYNLPTVEQGGEKEDKLISAVNRKFSKLLDTKPEACGFNVDIKFGQDGTSFPCAIITFEDAELYEKGKQKIQNYEFGSKNILQCVPFDEIDIYRNLGEHFVLPKADKINKMFTDDCRNWLCDKCREQLLLRYQQETEVHSWHSFDGLEGFYCGEKQKEQGKVWCDWEVQWSPYGSYVTTFHKPGVLIWGGDEMTNKRRFMHQQVSNVQFSPSEEYLVTWNGSSYEDKDSTAYKIWNIRTGKTVTTKPTPQYSPCGLSTEFPHFIFSHTSEYMARCTENAVWIHNMTNSCKPTCKPGETTPSPIKFENGVAHFKFSPKDNIIAVWSPHKGEIPARLTLVDIVTREELQTKSRTNFSAVMEWQSEGDFLCIALSKLTKAEMAAYGVGGKKASKELDMEDEIHGAPQDIRQKEKSLIGGEKPTMKNAKKLEIFRMREKNIPVESVDVDEVIKGFYWEPKGNRFALLTEGQTAQKTNLYFFSLEANKCVQVGQFELPSGAYNNLFWAPDGQYFVIASITGDNDYMDAHKTGELMWGRLTPSPEHKVDMLYKDEQYNLTNVEWDPSGRFVLTSVVQPITHASAALGQDTGYNIWSFQGRLMHRVMMEKLYHAAWRPHPPTYLTSEKERDVRKNLKAHSKRFDRADDMAKDKARNEVREIKERKIREFKDKMDALEGRFLDHARQPHIGWAEAWERFDDDHRWKDVTEPVEEIIDIKEEQIDF